MALQENQLSSSGNQETFVMNELYKSQEDFSRLNLAQQHMNQADQELNIRENPYYSEQVASR